MKDRSANDTPPPPALPPQEQERLDSWKQIAAYLGKSERTVHRWHQTEGLPINRHVHQQKASVWVYRSQLDAWLKSRQESSTADRPKASRSQSVLLIAAAAIVLFSVTAAVRSFLSRWSLRPVTAIEPVPLTALPGSTYGADFSPDGSQIVFHWTPPDQMGNGLYLMTVADAPSGPRPLMVATPGDVEFESFVNGPYRYSPAWSPDGTRIAYLRREWHSLGEATRLCFISPAGGEENCPLQIATSVKLLGHNRHVSWTSDGKWAIVPITAGVPQPGIYAFSMQSGEKRLLSGATAGVGAPALSPDDRTLIYLQFDGAGADELFRRDLTADLKPTGSALRLYKSSYLIKGWAWAPSGKDIIVCESSRLGGSFSGSAGLPGAFNNQLNRIQATPGGTRTLLHSDACNTINTSRANQQGYGLLAYARGSLNASGRMMRASTANLAAATAFVPSSRNDVLPEYSPDGRQVAFLSDRSGQQEVWLASRDGSEHRKLTEGSRVILAQAPRWSPDASKLLYATFSPSADISSPRRILQILVVSGGHRITIPLQRDAYLPAWSADGRHIYYWSDDGLWRVFPDGGVNTLMRSYSGKAIFQCIRHDNYMYYTVKDGFFHLERLDLSSDRKERLASGLTSPSFTMSNRHLYFVRVDKKPMIFALPLEGGEAREAGQLVFPAQRSRQALVGITVSPDDSEVLWSTGGELTLDLQLVRQFR